MRGKTSNERSRQDGTRKIPSFAIWYGIIVAMVIILAANTAILFVQMSASPDSEDTNLFDNANRSDTAGADSAIEVKVEQLFNEFRQEYLDLRVESVDWWLTVVTIVLGSFAVVVAIVGFVSFREFQRLKDEAKQHVEKIQQDGETISEAFQEFRDRAGQHITDMDEHRNILTRDLQTLVFEAGQHITEIEEHKNLLLKDFGTIKTEAEQHIEKIKEDINTRFRDFQTSSGYPSELNQASGRVREMTTERLDALIFDISTDDEEFEEILRDFRQIPHLSFLEEAVLEAYTLQQGERIEETIQKWRSIANIVEEKHNNLAAHAWKSIGYLYQEDRKEEALSAFDNAIRLRRDDAKVYALRGDVKALLGNYKSAIVDYNEAIRFGAKLEEMYSNRASAKNALRRYNHAITDCDEAIHLNSSYTEAYIVRSDARVELQDFSAAIVDLQRASELAMEQGQEDLKTLIEQRLQELRADTENL